MQVNNGIINDYIDINLILYSPAQSSQLHRKFAVLCAFKAGVTEDTIIINQANINDQIEKIELDRHINYIRLWFSSGGIELTAVDVNKIAQIEKIEPVNIIFAALEQDEQLTVYNALVGNEVIKYKSQSYIIENNVTINGTGLVGSLRTNKNNVKTITKVNNIDARKLLNTKSVNTINDLKAKVNQLNINIKDAKDSKEEARLIKQLNATNNELSKITKEYQQKQVEFYSEYNSYNKNTGAGTDLLSDKILYFTTSEQVVATGYPTAVYVNYMYTEINNNSCVFEYLAPYSNARAYRKNELEPSNLKDAGTIVNSITALRAGNIGALVYDDSVKRDLYVNMVDSTGRYLNQNYLAYDLYSDIQIALYNKMINAFPKLTYSNSTISECRLLAFKQVEYYVNNYLVANEDYNAPVVTSISVEEQAEEDVQNHIIKGITVSYAYLPEVKRIDVNLVERGIV